MVANSLAIVHRARRWRSGCDGRRCGRARCACDPAYRSTGRITFTGLTFRNGAPRLAWRRLLVQESSPSFIDVVFEMNRASSARRRCPLHLERCLHELSDSQQHRRALGWRCAYRCVPAGVYDHLHRRKPLGTGPAGIGDVGVGGGVDARNASPTFLASRISGNASVFAAGGIYHGGDFASPYGVSVMVLSDTEVADNTSTPFSPAWNPAEGGGIHIESNAVAQLTRVQVLRNRANTGGGLNAYRARYEIVDSIIEGNHATGRSDGGIAVITGSSTSTLAVPSNRRAWSCSRALSSATTSASPGEVLSSPASSADRQRYRSPTCDDLQPGQNQGGGILISNANLSASNSLILRNTVTGGSSPFGGGLLLTASSGATIVNSTLAANTAGGYGGGIFMDGTTGLDLRGSRVFNNMSGFSNGGGGLFVGPNGSNTGSVVSSIVADNAPYQIVEHGCPGPKLTFNSNTITPRTGTSDVYLGALARSARLRHSTPSTTRRATTPASALRARVGGPAIRRPRSTLAWTFGRATSVAVGGVGTFNGAAGSVDVASGSASYDITAAAASANGGNYTASATTVGVPPAAVASRGRAISTAGDFDGDGRTDLTVFRSAGSLWHHRFSTGTISVVQWARRRSDCPW